MRDPQAVAAMLCPICKVGLTMSDRAGIEIDYCPQCRGVWLDRGELDKIIERSAPTAPAQSAPAQAAPPRAAQPWAEPRGDYHRDYGHDPRYRHGKRKKSFLEELFD
jgi:uncharacterized protein